MSLLESSSGTAVPVSPACHWPHPLCLVPSPWCHSSNAFPRRRRGQRAATGREIHDPQQSPHSVDRLCRLLPLPKAAGRAERAMIACRPMDGRPFASFMRTAETPRRNALRDDPDVEGSRDHTHPSSHPTRTHSHPRRELLASCTVLYREAPDFSGLDPIYWCKSPSHPCRRSMATGARETAAYLLLSGGRHGRRRSPPTPLYVLD